MLCCRLFELLSNYQRKKKTLTQSIDGLDFFEELMPNDNENNNNGAKIVLSTPAETTPNWSGGANNTNSHANSSSNSDANSNIELIFSV